MVAKTLQWLLRRMVKKGFSPPPGPLADPSGGARYAQPGFQNLSFHAVFGNKNRLVQAFMTTQILKLMQITRVFLIAYVWGGRKIRLLYLWYWPTLERLTRLVDPLENQAELMCLVSTTTVLVGFPYSSPCKTSTKHYNLSDLKAVADPGFPKGGANPREGALTYFFGIIFCRKLHENEKKWTEGMLGTSGPLDPPLKTDMFALWNFWRMALLQLFRY